MPQPVDDHTRGERILGDQPLQLLPQDGSEPVRRLREERGRRRSVLEQGELQATALDDVGQHLSALLELAAADPPDASFQRINVPAPLSSSARSIGSVDPP